MNKYSQLQEVFSNSNVKLYKAKNSDNQEVCLKSVPLTKELSQNLDSIQKELDRWKLLDHPNIIKIYDHFSDQKNFYIAMEYLQGENIQVFTSKQKIPLEESKIISYLSQIVSALTALQKNNLVHRDLNSNNVFFNIWRCN